MLTVKKLKSVFLLSTLAFILFYFGVFTHLFESDFVSNFHYPYDGDIEDLVNTLRANLTPHVPPINKYNFHYYQNCSEKCRGVESLRLIYLVKSSPENFDRRLAIRNSWGYEHRFSDVEIRTVFLIGQRNDTKLMSTLEQESSKFKDTIRANFTDDYYNNTLKTMMGFNWAVTFCPKAGFYMFVDDDYYVSTKNVLRFVRNPVNYPKYLKTASPKDKRIRDLHQFDFDLDSKVRLYAGYAFESSPHRHFLSKWYVSLNEYPYDMWPPYITAGAYILSREALIDMFYASFYTKHFRFDDIYVALLALKCKIEPFHCDEFYFNKFNYDPKGYEFVIASHGFGNPMELVTIWSEQRSMGHA